MGASPARRLAFSGRFYILKDLESTEGDLISLSYRGGTHLKRAGVCTPALKVYPPFAGLQGH